MNDIHDLIEWLQAEQEKADKLAILPRTDGLYYLGKASGFSDVLQKLKTISKKS